MCKELFLLLAFTAFYLFGCADSPPKLDQEVYQSIGNQIRIERIEQKITQQALADSVGISQRSLSLIEDGLATPIHTKIIAIQDFLDVTFVINGKQQSIEAYLAAQQAAEGKK